MQEHKQMLYLGYHTVVISDMMSKLKVTGFLGDLKSKLKFNNKFKVIKKNENFRKLIEKCG